MCWVKLIILKTVKPYRRIIMFQNFGNFHFISKYGSSLISLNEHVWSFSLSFYSVVCNVELDFVIFTFTFLKMGTNECVGNREWGLVNIYVFGFFVCLFFSFSSLFIKCLCAVCGIKAFIHVLWALQNYRKKPIIKPVDDLYVVLSDTLMGEEPLKCNVSIKGVFRGIQGELETKK